MEAAAALDLLRGALRLNPGAFEALLSAPPAQGQALGLWVVLAAGLSSTLGQSVALIGSRVSKRRFAATVGLNALLFAGGFLLWCLALVALAALTLGAPPALANVVALVGLAHAPQLLGAFTLTPYFGSPLQALLSIWTLLATLVATATLFAIPAPAAALLAGSGWLLSQLLQRTLGRVVVRVGARVRRRWGRRGLGG